MARVADAVAGAERDHLVHVVEHRLLHAGRRRRTVLGLDRREAHRQQRRAPSTVASAGAEPDGVTLDHGHPQGRVASQEMQRRPQPGEPTADDRHVDVEVALEGRKGNPFVFGERVRPHGAAVRRCGPATGDIALNVGGGGHPQAARVTVRYTTGMSTFPPPTTAPAGWYPDPTNGGTRYFDGRVWAPIQPVFEEREAHPDLPLAAAIGALGVLVASLLVGRTLGSLVADVAARRDRVRVRRRDRLRTVGDVGVVRHASLGRRQPVGRRLQVSMGRSRLGTIDVAVGGGQPTRDVRGGGAVPHPDHQQRRRRVRSRRHAIYQVATVLAAVVAAPFVEELVFRGVVLRGFLSRLGPVAAIALQGLLFGFADS